MTDGLGGGFPGARNRYIWLQNPTRPASMPELAGSLGELSGSKRDVSWGVFPLVGRDALYVATNGGGGYLDPLERDPQSVFRDVRDRVVSVDMAKNIYGTVVTNGVLDLAATAALRRTIIARRRERRT
jgi:N-methylhydantoinase B